MSLGMNSSSLFRYLPKSFRWRLTLWNTTIISLLILFCLFGVRESLRFTLLDEIDQLLREDAAEIALSLQKYADDPTFLGDELRRKAEGHYQRDWYGEILRTDGTSICHSSFQNQSQQLFLPLTPGQFRTLNNQRFFDYLVILPNQTQRIVRVAESLHSVERDIERVTRSVNFVGLFLLLIAPGGGWWLAVRAISPLSDMIQTTKKLRPHQLDERLPIRGTNDELDQLGTTVNGFLDRIAAYLSQQRIFLADVSHELRSPLTALQATIEVSLLQERSVQDYQNTLDQISQECERLSRLVRQLLLIAESESGRAAVSFTKFQLAEIILPSVEMFYGLAESREIQIYCEPIPTCYLLGNSNQLRQVIHNLLDNAIRYSAEKTTISIVCTQFANEVQIQILDEGCGIPEHELRNVFDRFYRLESSRNRSAEGGTGLGLSICKAIVLAHQGQIEARNRLPSGTEFRFRLPLANHT
ncbi:sensor histidine kinase [Tuwongella immobilis]|uniref:histidine kinase n=1 Tax=Tuwongella immobilis TaxID=692036 RepID=A0A6C2YNH5_9BACT|nr:ATP-binding protein [Tuwongella immobilis]VIP02442.1 histidine kinase : Histidine kinase OS=Pirellula staleyi (strain ATCC 27377 / DSM 6068 / ICPB 4128) GN=Psta_3236 PE=4 SV=1: HAMP: HisKA: HATPase_c [Tuwongella immobilis]VTS01410.1 histidine kinase : Histidine kinase OS=Pirellula staleyi (strain ATCC 27377 / DSM 6068 / ICPB 4128) GN=Psta_3236 PE=4 SV=1: HAMP: HisKA: HATPase_c [Tuwongella immobilis]